MKVLGKALLVLLALAGIAFVAYHDWVAALAALLLIFIFCYTDLPRIISQSPVGRLLDVLGRGVKQLLKWLCWPLKWLWGKVKPLLLRLWGAVRRILPKRKTRDGNKRGFLRRFFTMERRRSMEALIFLTPWIVGLCMFFLGPITTSIRLAFSEITKMKGFEMGFVGLRNFNHIFFTDINFVPMFLQTVLDTLLNTPICIVFSLVIAILINRPMRGRGFFRAAFFIPVLLGAGYVMKQMLGMGADGTTITTGIVVPELIADLLGHSLTEFLQGVLDRITVVLWKSGVQIVLFLAGLQGISTSLYEAARVDGATEWEMFWKVTLPMISPVILMNLVYTIVAFFTDATNPIIDYIYKTSFTNQQFGYGAAMSWIYFAFALLMCGVTMGVVGRYVFISGGKE